MRETNIVDMDDTIAMRGPLSRVLIKLSHLLYDLAFLAERPNWPLIRRVAGSRLIVLTGRSRRMERVTRRQLAKLGLSPERVITYPLLEEVHRWKREKVKEILEGERGQVTWYDDMDGPRILVRRLRK